MSASDDLFQTHDIFPPNGAEEKRAWLRLIRSRRVGVSTFFRLLKDHGSAEEALSQLPQIARHAGVDRYQPFGRKAADAELKSGAQAGAILLFYGDAHYPKALMKLSDPPPAIWAKGDLSHLARPIVALIGARNASSNGMRMAGLLAKTLGEAGYVVASGLARGIDTSAHAGAIETGTIAVLGGGVDDIYPKQNAALYGHIADRGVLLSEFPMGTPARARNFPIRNRIVAGLSQAVIVVEAAARSGSLNTARTALDEGREVMAVPAHPFDGRGFGCNALLKDGAVLVRSAKDILEALPSSQLPSPEPHTDTLKPTSPKAVQNLHQIILDRLNPAPISEDSLIRDMDTPADVALQELTKLELMGKIKRQNGSVCSI
ncbi:MAG: DNA-processing protein DprA [Halocynthiibacter sp.]